MCEVALSRGNEAPTGRQSAPIDEESLFVPATGQASEAADGQKKLTGCIIGLAVSSRKATTRSSSSSSRRRRGGGSSSSGSSSSSSSSSSSPSFLPIRAHLSMSGGALIRHLVRLSLWTAGIASQKMFEPRPQATSAMLYRPLRAKHTESKHYQVQHNFASDACCICPVCA